MEHIAVLTHTHSLKEEEENYGNIERLHDETKEKCVRGICVKYAHFSRIHQVSAFGFFLYVKPPELCISVDLFLLLLLPALLFISISIVVTLARSFSNI